MHIQIKIGAHIENDVIFYVVMVDLIIVNVNINFYLKMMFCHQWHTYASLKLAFIFYKIKAFFFQDKRN